jgi:hypothetical protein
MGLSDCEPIRFGFLFERLNSRDRIDVADADYTFMFARRHKVVASAMRAARQWRRSRRVSQRVPATGTSVVGGKGAAMQRTKIRNKETHAAASCGYRWLRVRLGRDRLMEPWALITQLASALREFVAPRYRPELYYMRGPGPASARRMSTR